MDGIKLFYIPLFIYLITKLPTKGLLKMSTKTINSNQLTPGKLILVNGILDYCHITSLIQGEELKKLNERNVAHGWQPKNRPHTKAAVRNASVIMQNPNEPTIEERYISERLYTSPQNPEKNYCYTAENSGTNLPWVGVIRTGTTNIVDQIQPEGELAAGLNVTLVLRVYKPKSQLNNGVSLDGVIVNEPVRYYQNNAINAGLSELGITFNPIQNAAPAEPQPEMPTTAPAAPAPQAVPFTPAAPEPAPFTAQPAFTAPPAVNPYAVPQNTPQEQNNGGIRYNPAERNY